MKVKEKSYSVIVVSGGATSKNKAFSISTKLIRYSIIAFIALLITLGFITFDYLNTSLSLEEMKHLEKDNMQKERTLAKLDKHIDQVQQRVDQMASYKDKVLVVIGQYSPERLVIGEGGDVSDFGEAIPNVSPVLNTPGNNSIINSTKQETGNNLLKKSGKIRKMAINIHKELKKVEYQVEKRKIRLESTPHVWPTKGYITSTIGWRIHPITGARDYHNGLDIATQYGSKVIAAGSGVVLAAEYWSYLGNLVIIDHGFGFTTLYSHLASFSVKAGQRVKRYQVIGYVGSTGRSSAPHLHYEVKYYGKNLNPMTFIID